MSTLLDFKCPACGGAIQFDSATQKMKCPYCDTELDMTEMQAQDDILDTQSPDIDNSGASAPDVEADNLNWNNDAGNEWSNGETDNMSVFVCKSCGGEIVGDENTAATSCPFCGNPVVMSGRLSGMLKPDFVIPFKLDKKAAKEQYQKHISGKFLLPKLFKQENHIDEIKGVYVPFWLYDSDISASANFDAHIVRTWSDSKYEYTETKNYDVFRGGNMSFNNIPVDGSTVMDDALMESIEPFDFKDAVPFSSAYLAGYFADKYDVDSKQSEQRANDRLRQSAMDVLKSTAEGYTTVDLADETKSGVQILKGTVKYALYPVWLLTSAYKGKKYTFAMNGQTGKFVGDLPVDTGKKNLTFAGIFAAVTTAVTILSYLFFD